MSEDVKHSPTPAPADQARTAELDGTYLGEGAQYQVYDMGDGHVRKIPQTLDGSITAIRQWHKGSDEEVASYAENVGRLRDQGASYVKSLIERFPEASELFGNPKFKSDGSVIQDHLTTIGEAMKDATQGQAQDMIVDYVRSIAKTWRYGCYDWVFNFVSNAAMRDGKAVVMDFGEMGLDKKTMHDIIHSRAWESSYDVQNRLTPELRGFFVGFARSYLTHDKLDSEWGKLL